MTTTATTTAMTTTTTMKMTTTTAKIKTTKSLHTEHEAGYIRPYDATSGGRSPYPGPSN